MTISTRDIAYQVDGLGMVAHLARPSGQGPWPAVLIGHDGVGLDAYQRSRADDLAAHGYLALAMDYHGGQTYFGRPDAMLARTMPLLGDEKRMQAIGRAAFDILLAEPGVEPDRIAALGYGAGGRIVLELARTGVPFKAIAVVHPAFPPANAHDWTGKTGTVLLCTGSEDPICTPEQVLTFGRALQEAGLDWRATIHGGAKHAFWARPTHPDGSPAEGATHAEATVPGVGYHPEAAVRAWQAVLDLLDETFTSSGVERA
ncbi:dienelactone hydrolase family protein [Alsobacter sp. KACC 23698]|uniref:Dienelactone hydrolase family protein n=1 Tax=Alsobacter sp. KACC 23698 TaxID=3149229 RepID=A0AAU7JDQ4_9HYPH